MTPLLYIKHVLTMASRRRKTAYLIDKL